MEKVKQLFSFGCGHTLANRFVSIEAESAERCREIMVHTFGDRWSMQYDWSLTQLERFAMHNMDGIMHIEEDEHGTLTTLTKEAIVKRI